jgi:hypothetical protein
MARPPLMVMTWAGVMPWQEPPAACREPFLRGFHD